VIDLEWTRKRFQDRPDDFFIKPSAIADEILACRSPGPKRAWSFNVELRPFKEKLGAVADHEGNAKAQKPCARWGEEYGGCASRKFPHLVTIGDLQNASHKIGCHPEKMRRIAKAAPTHQEATLSEDVLVTREERGNISVLTMVYRPYNLLGPKLINAIVEQVETAQKSGSRAIVIRSGLRHFSAGADLDIFDKRVAAGTTDQANENRRLTGVEFLRFMELLPIPLIASVHGVCLGGGLELALACDYIIAASSAKIGSVEATLGLHPLLGGIQRQVQRIGAQRAKEMSMLARRYDAPTLEKWGLINLTVPEESLEQITMTIAEEFAQGPTVAHAATKQLAHIAVNEGVDAADEAMAKVQAPIWASEDLKIGLASFRKVGPGLAKFVGR
jgi:enoyl-CoA hydratase/carnithine racemase